MPELVEQLDRAAARVLDNSTDGRGPVFTRTGPLVAPRDEQADHSILFAVGIILGCIILGVLLLAFATASNSSQPPDTRSSSAPAAQSASPAHTDEKNEGAKNIAVSSRRELTRGPVASRRGKGPRKQDGRKIGNAYVVAEPGKTPKMFEPQ
jgi:hypothetical protein